MLQNLARVHNLVGSFPGSFDRSQNFENFKNFFSISRNLPSTCQISDQLDHWNRNYRAGQNPPPPPPRPYQSAKSLACMLFRVKLCITFWQQILDRAIDIWYSNNVPALANHVTHPIIFSNSARTGCSNKFSLSANEKYISSVQLQFESRAEICVIWLEGTPNTVKQN